MEAPTPAGGLPAHLQDMVNIVIQNEWQKISKRIYILYLVTMNKSDLQESDIINSLIINL